MAWTAKDEEHLGKFLVLSHAIERVLDATRVASSNITLDCDKDNWLDDAIVFIKQASEILVENGLDESYQWSADEPLIQEAIASFNPNRQPIEFDGYHHHTWHDAGLQSSANLMADMLDACGALQDDNHCEFYDFELLRRKRSCIWKWNATRVVPPWDFVSTGIVNERAMVTAYARREGRGEINTGGRGSKLAIPGKKEPSTRGGVAVTGDEREQRIRVCKMFCNGKWKTYAEFAAKHGYLASDVKAYLDWWRTQPENPNRKVRYRKVTK
jgi:hypothetical protein